MFCKKCGAGMDEGAKFCNNCGEAAEEQVVVVEQVQSSNHGYQNTNQHQANTTYQMPVNVPNYLAFSIIVTILCCWPLGIPAIVFAAQVNGKMSTGDIAGAKDSSSKAKMFCWIAFGLGLAFWVVYGILMGLGIFSSMM